MKRAIEYINGSDNVYKTKYRGEILYNILMVKHDTMLVNNLVCETLHPENPLAKLYMKLKEYTPEQQEEIVKKYNRHTVKTNKFSENQLKRISRCL